MRKSLLLATCLMAFIVPALAVPPPAGEEQMDPQARRLLHQMEDMEWRHRREREQERYDREGNFILVNDSSYRLKAVIFDAHWSSPAGEIVLQPKQSTAWHRKQCNWALFRPYPPYKIEWYRMNGDLYGSAESVNSDDTVFASAGELGSEESAPHDQKFYLVNDTYFPLRAIFYAADAQVVGEIDVGSREKVYWNAHPNNAFRPAAPPTPFCIIWYHLNGEEYARGEYFFPKGKISGSIYLRP